MQSTLKMSEPGATDLFQDAVTRAVSTLGNLPGLKEMPASERLLAFHFILLDELEATDMDTAALASAFNDDASPWWSPFHKSVRKGLGIVAEAPDVPGVNRLIGTTEVARFLVTEFLVNLISTTLQDDSEDRQRSAALADRLLSLAATVLTSPVPGKAVDAGRYAIEAGYIPVERIPFISNWLKDNEKN